MLPFHFSVQKLQFDEESIEPPDVFEQDVILFQSKMCDKLKFVFRNFEVFAFNKCLQRAPPASINRISTIHIFWLCQLTNSSLCSW